MSGKILSPHWLRLWDWPVNEEPNDISSYNYSCIIITMIQYRPIIALHYPQTRFTEVVNNVVFIDAGKQITTGIYA